MSASHEFSVSDGRTDALLSLLALQPGSHSGHSAVLTVDPDLWHARQTGAAVVDLRVMLGMDANGAEVSATFRPGTAADLDRQVRELAPDVLLIDHTILLGRLVNRWQGHNEERDGWIPELVGLLPVPLFSDPEKTDGLSALVAWGAGLLSLTALSVALPRGLMKRESAAPWREYIQQCVPLRAALGLPPGLFERARWLGFTILYFGGDGTNVLADTVSSANELDRFRGQPWFQRLTGWLVDGEPTPAYMCRAEDVFSWPSETGVEEVVTRLGRLAPVEVLGALCQIENGIAVSHGGVSDESGWLLISGSVLSDGFIDFDHAITKQLQKDPPRRTWLLPGDIVLPDTITELSAAVVNMRAARACVTSSAIRVRITDPRLTPEYLVEYLNSSTAREILLARAKRNDYFGSPKITAAILRELPVPLLDPAQFDGLARIEETEEALRRLADRLRMQRRELFGARNAREFQQNLHDLRRRGTLYERGIERADSIAYQISNFYPFPIAYGYRLLANHHDKTMLYKEQLRIAENLLAFMGSVALALVPEAQRGNLALDIRKIWQGGISPGQWREAVIHACRCFEKHVLGDMLQGLNIGSEKGFGGSVQALIGAKNDFKHDRGPSTATEYDREAERIQGLLDSCMASLAFFTDHPIMHLLDYDRTRHGEWVVECTRFTGDHPGLETQRETLSEMPMALPIKGELYIAVHGTLWFSLYPYLTVQECSHCHAQETYFVDRWDDRKGVAVLKSFERGHTWQSEDIAVHLERVQGSAVLTTADVTVSGKG